MPGKLKKHLIKRSRGWLNCVNKWFENMYLMQRPWKNYWKQSISGISAGKLFWKGTHAIIVSKSDFTKSAHQLAKSNKVELINEYQLKDWEKFIV